MHTDTHKEEMPAGDGNPTAGSTDSTMVTGALIRIKAEIVRAVSWLAIVLRGMA